MRLARVSHRHIEILVFLINHILACEVKDYFLVLLRHIWPVIVRTLIS